MKPESAISPVPMPDGYKRCMELSKGFTRAGMEAGSVARWRLLNYVINSIVFVVIPLMLFFLTTENSDDSFALNFGHIYLFTILFVFLAVMLVSMRILASREYLMGVLNNLYYKINGILGPYLVDGETILATLAVADRKLPVDWTRRIQLGLFVLTTHRLFLLTTDAPVKDFEKAIQRKDFVTTDVVDYSSAANLLPPVDVNFTQGSFYAKQVSVKPHESDDYQKWRIMPTDSNNFRLLEAILEHRDRIE